MGAVIGDNFLVCGRCKLSRRKQIAEKHFDSASGAADWNPGFNVAPAPARPSDPPTSQGVRAGIVTHAFYRASGSRQVGLRRSHKSDVQLPIPVEGSLLDFLLAKQEVQRRTDSVPALSKLCRQIILAHHHLPGRVAAMYAACIA
jgi:hypothetical protein